MNTNPYGLLYGTRYQLGNFDQCLSTVWSSERSDLKSQYCIVDIFHQGDKVIRPMKELLQPIDPYQPVKTFINVMYLYLHL